MRLAWFAPRPDPVALALRQTHHVDQFDAARAHDFVWRHFRAPYDLTIVELADTPAHSFVWPYLFHDPGILLLRATSVLQSRSQMLTLQHRRGDLREERAFGGPGLLGAPLAAARLVVVHDEAVARELRAAYPHVDTRVLPVGATAAPLVPGPTGVRFRFPPSSSDTVERAAARARDAGTHIDLAAGLDDLSPQDVPIVLEWPPTGAPPADALSAMAAGLAVILLETEAIAAWPAIDPQTWQPRGFLASDAPIVVSIDPRDEEHSLMLAMKRLTSDAALRQSIGIAAARWTSRHASVRDAAAAWEVVLHDARDRHITRADDALPAHLTADGTARARAVLGEIGVSVDFLDS